MNMAKLHPPMFKLLGSVSRPLPQIRMVISTMEKCKCIHGFFIIQLYYRRQGQPHIREGRGILVKKDGALYEGWFRNNKFHGRGRVISA